MCEQCCLLFYSGGYAGEPECEERRNKQGVYRTASVWQEEKVNNILFFSEAIVAVHISAPVSRLCLGEELQLQCFTSVPALHAKAALRRLGRLTDVTPFFFSQASVTPI
jgi:hypothetical protein